MDLSFYLRTQEEELSKESEKDSEGVVERVKSLVIDDQKMHHKVRKNLWT